jgi:hypothetical protein
MWKRFLAAATIVLLIACGDSPTDPTAASLAGTWTLQTVNGAAVPFTLVGSGANRTDLTKGSVALSSTGGYTQSVELVTYTSGQPATNTLADAGTFTIDGSTITFTSSNGGAAQAATVSGSSMTLAFQGTSVVYVKK